MTQEIPNEPGLENSIQQPQNVEIAVPFRPYEMATRFMQQMPQHFLIAESYTHTLLLRRELQYEGIQGVVDVISEDPKGPHWPLEKPLGGAAFCYAGTLKDGFSLEEKPFILRFAFLPRTPAEYTTLLHSYIRVKLRKEEYELYWNWNRPGVKRNMQKLETGVEVVVTQKDLFNVKEIPGDVDDVNMEAFENTEVGCLTFVWMPKKLNRFKRIQLTFHKFGGGDYPDELVEPTPPITGRVLVPVA
jgi:hypothetical protein